MLLIFPFSVIFGFELVYRLIMSSRERICVHKSITYSIFNMLPYVANVILAMHCVHAS